MDTSKQLDVLAAKPKRNPWAHVVGESTPAPRPVAAPCVL